MMRWDSDGRTSAPITVNVKNWEDLSSKLEGHLQAGEGFSVATINLDHVVKLRRDAAFARAYREQTLVTADGNPIVWLSRLAGQKDVDLIPGSEMIEPMMRLAATQGASVGMFGSIESSLHAAAEVLTGRIPNLQVAMVRSPGMDFDPEGEEAQMAVEAIAESGARIIYLALGAPKQERFAAFAQKRLPQVGFVSIGAGLDFASGAQTRAPVWVRKLALEWVWRMFGNPKRLFGRYAACALAMPRLTLRALQQRKSAV